MTNLFYILKHLIIDKAIIVLILPTISIITLNTINWETRMVVHCINTPPKNGTHAGPHFVRGKSDC